MFLADGEHQGAALFLLLSPSLFCPATYSAPVDFTVSFTEKRNSYYHSTL